MRFNDSPISHLPVGRHHTNGGHAGHAIILSACFTTERSTPPTWASLCHPPRVFTFVTRRFANDTFRFPNTNGRANAEQTPHAATHATLHTHTPLISRKLAQRGGNPLGSDPVCLPSLSSRHSRRTVCSRTTRACPASALRRRSSGDLWQGVVFFVVVISFVSTCCVNLSASARRQSLVGRCLRQGRPLQLF